MIEPSVESVGSSLAFVCWARPPETETRLVTPVARTWTKTSVFAFVSAATRVVASDW
jgi:hypothetical protein